MKKPRTRLAREVLELHTLGVTDQGRRTGIPNLTLPSRQSSPGGTIQRTTGGFRFVANRHSPAPSRAGSSIRSMNGPSEESRCSVSCAPPSTARHLAKKLCEFRQRPAVGGSDHEAASFYDSNGDIKKFSLRSSLVGLPQRGKLPGQVKTPLEYLVGLYRNLGVWSSRDPFRTRSSTSDNRL